MSEALRLLLLLRRPAASAQAGAAAEPGAHDGRLGGAPAGAGERSGGHRTPVREAAVCSGHRQAASASAVTAGHGGTFKAILASEALWSACHQNH